MENKSIDPNNNLQALYKKLSATPLKAQLAEDFKDENEFSAYFSDANNLSGLYEKLQKTPLKDQLDKDFKTIDDFTGYFVPVKKKVGTEESGSAGQSISKANVTPGDGINLAMTNDYQMFWDGVDLNEKKIKGDQNVRAEKEKYDAFKKDVQTKFMGINMTDIPVKELEEIKKEYRNKGYRTDDVESVFTELSLEGKNIYRDNYSVKVYRDAILEQVNSGEKANPEKAANVVKNKMVAEANSMISPKDKQLAEANKTIKGVLDKENPTPEDFKKYEEAMALRDELGYTKTFYNWKTGKTIAEEAANDINPIDLISEEEVAERKNLLGKLSVSELEKAAINSWAEMNALRELAAPSENTGMMTNSSSLAGLASPGLAPPFTGKERVQEFKYNEKGEKYLSMLRDASVKFKAASELLILNRDPLDIQKNISFKLGAMSRALQTGIFGEETMKEMESKSPGFKVQSEMFDAINTFVNEEGIQITDEQKQQLDKTLGQKSFEIVGGVLPVIPQLMFLNKVQGAVGLTSLFGKWASSGNRMMNLVGKYVAPAIAEEAKMVAVDPESRGVGIGFFVGGQMMPSITLGKGVAGKIFQPYFDAIVKGGTGATVGSQLGQIFDGAVRSIRDDKEFRSITRELGWDNLDEKGEDILAEWIAMGALGIGHINSAEKAIKEREKW